MNHKLYRESKVCPILREAKGGGRSDFRIRSIRRAGFTRRTVTLPAICMVLSITPFVRADQSQPTAQERKRTDDLAKRLIEPTESQDQDAMSQVLRLMQQSRERMRHGFDPGTETQAIQRRIIDRLDDAIQTALKNRTETPIQSARTNDTRQMPEPDQESQTAAAESKSGTESGEHATREVQSADENENRRSDAFKESRRGWGRLPDRQREEIIQGAQDEYLEQYRELIERYYRALAEPVEEHNQVNGQ